MQQPCSESLSVYCPGDGRLAAIITSDGLVAVQWSVDNEVARSLGLGRAGCFVRSVAALGLRNLCDTLLRDPFPGVRVLRPRRGNYGQIYFLDFYNKGELADF